MSTVHEGGCLCGAIRYKATAEPQRVFVCHCTFCQRITGTAFLVEAVFGKADVVLSGEKPRTYDHRSDESGKRVTPKFCGACGTTLFLDAEVAPDFVLICGGTFDDPNWFDRNQGNFSHKFTRSAQEGVIVPANTDIHEGSHRQSDGTPNEPVVFPHAVMARGGRKI